ACDLLEVADDRLVLFAQVKERLVRIIADGDQLGEPSLHGLVDLCGHSLQSRKVAVDVIGRISWVTSQPSVQVVYCMHYVLDAWHLTLPSFCSLGFRST